jgi:tetratricopeptide (TPR) repeat protein
MTHFRNAEELTNRERNPEEWAEVQYAIADLLLDQGKYNEAEKTLRAVVEVRSQLFGPEHPDTLRSQNRLAYAVWRQGRFKDAQTDFRQLVAVQEKVLGPDNPDTLSAEPGCRTLVSTWVYCITPWRSFAISSVMAATACCVSPIWWTACDWPLTSHKPTPTLTISRPAITIAHRFTPRRSCARSSRSFRTLVSSASALVKGWNMCESACNRRRYAA